MSKERDFRKLITGHLSKPDWEFTPVESGGTVSGIPDTFFNYAPGHAHGWLELKVTTGWKVELSPHQVGWLTRHARSGVRCRVGVRQLGTDRDVLWLLDGAQAARFAAEGLPREYTASAYAGVLLRAAGPARRWDWTAIAAALLS